jgi:hypothetical protein
MVWLSAKDWPTVKRPFAESFLLSALGEGFSCRRHRRNRNVRLRPLNSPRARRTWPSAKKYTPRRRHFHREHCIFGECFVSAHGKCTCSCSHSRVQTFSLIHIHSYNVHVQNWHHFVFVCYIYQFHFFLCICFLYVRYELQVHKIIEQICSKNGIHVHETSLRPCT